MKRFWLLALVCGGVSLFFIYSIKLVAHSANQSNDIASLHLEWLDVSANLGKNFYQFADGGWRKKNQIPADRSGWNIFSVVNEQNNQKMKNILEAFSHESLPIGSDEQKVSDFYVSGMDEASINREGVKPLQDEFFRIQSIKNVNELEDAVAHLQLMGVEPLFGFGEGQDFFDSNQVIGEATQGGLSLPNRDYYLKSSFKAVRAAYLDHIVRMLVLSGEDKAAALEEANVIMAMETKLAQQSMSQADQRDPHRVYHMKDLNELHAVMPHFDWVRYFTALNHPEIRQINLAEPDFFAEVDRLLSSESINHWQMYLRWHLLQAYADELSQPFVDEDLKMAAAITGVQKIEPRWKRVLETENQLLGFALGKLYVNRYFPESTKKNATSMINDIRAALRNDLKTLNWMSESTRLEALKKLDKMTVRVGYPDQWWDYSKLTIDRGPYVLNVMRANQFLSQRELNKIGKPVDRTEWTMVPQEVNAYYDPSNNSLTIPAGILQPPFYDPNASPAVNFGAIGFVAGHEITHGFDDEGAQFDEMGNLKNWWRKVDLDKFHQATQCISDQFSSYRVPEQNHHSKAEINGPLVTGEAVADLGGLTLAYRALHASNNKPIMIWEGYTPDQQFFISAAHAWAGNVRPEKALLSATIDPHPPGKYRVNGTLANMAEFQQAFNLSNHAKMVNPHRCVIW